MRTITTRPDLQVPNLLESDIDNNLIIGYIDRVSEKRIVYAVKYYDPELHYNWYGTDFLGGILTPRFYIWSVSHYANLLDHIIRSWTHWHDVPKMFICETTDDVNTACNEIGPECKDCLRLELIDQFKSIESARTERSL